MPFEYIIYGLLYALWIALVIRYRRVSVLVLPFFFPFYLFRFDVLGIPIYFIEGLIAIAAVPVFFEIFFGEHKELLNKSVPQKVLHMFKSLFKHKEKPVLDFLKSPFFPIVLFLVACLISASIVPDENFKQALGILKSWVIIPVIFFIILHKTIKQTKDITFAMYSYVASALFLGLWALYQGVSGNYTTIDQRVSGPFESANYLAMYIAPALVYCSVRFIQTFIQQKFETADTRWNDVERRIYIAGFVAILFAILVLTQSYGGLIGVFATLFLYIVFEWMRLPKGPSRTFLSKLVGYALLIFILGGSIAVSLNYEKFLNLTKFNERTSISTRVEIWTVGAELLKESPFLGIGLGQYETQYVERAEEILEKVPFESKRLHSHNLYMSFWLNAGLLGLISFLWIVVLAYMQLKQTLDREQKNVLIACLAMLTYVLIHGMLDVTFWKNDLALIFWLILSGVLLQKRP